MFRRGDIVRTPGESGAGLYSGILAIVMGGNSHGTVVHSGKAELAYNNDDLTLFARIAVGKRRYRTPSGNRFNACVVSYTDGRSEEIHVQTGARGEGEETRAFEIRKLVFIKLSEATRHDNAAETHHR
jgi:hypothetical protein